MPIIQIGDTKVKLPIALLRVLMSGVTPNEALEVYEACDQMLDVDPNVLDVNAIKRGLLTFMPEHVRGRIQAGQVNGACEPLPIKWEKRDIDLGLLNSLMRKMFIEDGSIKRKLQKAIDKLVKRVLQPYSGLKTITNTDVEIHKGNYSLFIVTQAGSGDWGEIDFEVSRADGKPFIQPELDVINSFPIRLTVNSKVNTKKSNPGIPMTDNFPSSVELMYRFNIQDGQIDRVLGTRLTKVPKSATVIDLIVNHPDHKKK